jgi:hypothetical protein
MLVLCRIYIYIDGEIPHPERDCRVFEDCAGIVIERLVAILTEIPLILSIAAMFDH